MISNVNLILSLLISVKFLSLSSEATAQWQKIPNPFDDPKFNTQYEFRGYRIITKDTLIGFGRNKETQQIYVFKSFNQGTTWEQSIYKDSIRKNDLSFQVIQNKTFLFYDIFSKDTLEIVFSKDYGTTWQQKRVVIKGLSQSSQIQIINENSFYVYCELCSSYPTVRKYDISGIESIVTPIFTHYTGMPGCEGVTRKYLFYFIVPREGCLFINAYEEYKTYRTPQLSLYSYNEYTLFTENDGYIWFGFSGNTNLSTIFGGPIHTPFKRFINTSRRYEVDNIWTYANAGTVYAVIEDSIGSVIMYGENSLFSIRPSQPFNPIFLKEQMGIKYIPTLILNYPLYDILFTDTNRAYCTNCDTQQNNINKPLFVFDRYKGLKKIPTPDLINKEVGLAYADQELVYISASSGYEQDSSWKYELYMLKTSDIVGINDDDTKQAALVVVYPNPAENILRWNIDDGTAEITDMQGWSMQQLPASARQADVSGLAAGVYVLTVRTAAGAVSRTFVKE